MRLSWRNSFLILMNSITMEKLFKVKVDKSNYYS
jgi:hypothetical protein